MAGRMVKPQIYGQEKPTLDAARQQRSIYSVLDDDPDSEEILEQCRKKEGDKKSLSSPPQPNGSSWRRAYDLKLKRKD